MTTEHLSNQSASNVTTWDGGRFIVSVRNIPVFLLLFWCLGLVFTSFACICLVAARMRTNGVSTRTKYKVVIMKRNQNKNVEAKTHKKSVDPWGVKKNHSALSVKTSSFTYSAHSFSSGQIRACSTSPFVPSASCSHCFQRSSNSFGHSWVVFHSNQSRDFESIRHHDNKEDREVFFTFFQIFFYWYDHLDRKQRLGIFAHTLNPIHYRLASILSPSDSVDESVRQVCRSFLNNAFIIKCGFSRCARNQEKECISASSTNSFRWMKLRLSIQVAWYYKRAILLKSLSICRLNLTQKINLQFNFVLCSKKEWV